MATAAEPSATFLTNRPTPLIIAAVLAALAVIAGQAVGTNHSDQWLLSSRYTARASFAVFVIVYSASSLVRLWPHEATKALVRRRRQWGLGFALAHTVHLAALSYYNVIILNMPGLQALVGGGLAYGLMFVMAATSNNASMKAMGKWWKRIHTVGIHWIWTVFAFSYFGRLFDPGLWIQGAVLFPISLAILGLRIWAWQRSRPAHGHLKNGNVRAQ
jgi:methionine sulfoxide reductase heme-binding subunit